MQNYDTREIRTAARNVDKLAGRLDNLKRTKVSQARESVRDLQGDTVNAIREQLDALSEEIRSLYRSLENSADALFEFARQLDIADEKAKTMISSK